MQIEGSVVLVTGSNRGLGRSFIEELLKRGVRRVYAAARTHVAYGDDRVVPVRLDITDRAQVTAAVAAAPDVEILVNNAGRNTAYSVLQLDPEDLRRDFDVNVHGTLAVTRAFVPVLSAARQAAIVNVLSVVSMAAIPMVGGYSATKAALWSITQSLRAELRSRNIRVHNAFPGGIDTDMSREYNGPKAAPQAVAAAVLDGVAAGREDIATDPMSTDTVELFARDPHELARRFTS